MKRHGLLLAGESGMGIDSSGEILMRALMQMGFWISSDREYPSLIKGGQANYNINFADQPLRGASRIFQVGLGMGLEGLTYCLEHVAEGGTIVHNFEKREQGIPGMIQIAKEKNYTIHYIPSREYVLENNLHTLFENSLVIGAAAKTLGLPYDTIHSAFKHKYGKKEKLRTSNETCLKYGYDLINQNVLPLSTREGAGGGVKTPTRLFLDGNTSLALGAIHAGVRTYFAYPMSPSSSILGYFAATAMESGVLVKQVEDEISAIQMTLGSMYAGTRSLTATSGGGFDLMTETISLSGMTEVPCVCVIAQRPGPATGLPTWTAQGDLLLATYAGHGEFARIVIGVADSTSAYELIQHAFNLAEEFHIPVIVLTEKLIAENRQTIEILEQGTIPIKRGLVSDPKDLKKLTPSDRYKITDSGVSKRRIPTTSETISYTNGDEHHEDGTLDETEGVSDMIAKRVRKTETILKNLPDPVLYGAKSGNILYIGRGSTLGLFQDIIEYDKPEGISYLHIAYLWPLKTNIIESLAEKFDQIIVIENNATGQLHTLLRQHIHKNIKLQKFLKRNGRQFCIEEILEHIQDSR